MGTRPNGSAICGVALLVLLMRDHVRATRWLAVGAVASVIIAWGVAQWPYILPETLKVADAAAPSSTLVALLVAAGGAVVIVLPGFILLYTLDQRSLLTGEGVESPDPTIQGGAHASSLPDVAPQ